MANGFQRMFLFNSGNVSSMLLPEGEIQAGTSVIDGNPQSFHTVWVLNSWDTTWYNKTRTTIKCSTSPSSVSLSIAPSPSPTNLKQTLNGYIGLSSNYRANHQLNESLAWLNQSQSPVLTYFKASLFTIPMPHLWSIHSLKWNLIQQDWTSEHKNIFPQKVPSYGKSSHLSTSTTRHLCHCMGFLTSFRAPVLHGVDRWPHPNDQNFLRPTSKKKWQVLNVFVFFCVGPRHYFMINWLSKKMAGFLPTIWHFHVWYMEGNWQRLCTKKIGGRQWTDFLLA